MNDTQATNNLVTSGAPGTGTPGGNKNSPKLLLPIIAFLASLALVVLALFIYFDIGQNKPLTANTTPRPSKTTSPAPVSEELNPTPAPSGFAIQFDPAGPTPTPVPPGNEPARLRVLADDYYNQGRPVEAAAQYRLILDNHAGSPQVQGALYGLGRASVLRGRYNEAADAFKKYLANYPNDPLRRYCFYYLGLVSKQQGFWEEAVNYFQKYQAEPGDLPLDGYTFFEMADAYQNMRKPQLAMEAYKQVANLPTSQLLKVTALETLGDYYVKENNPAEAVGWYARLVEISKVRDYKASVIAKQARAHDAAKQADKASTLTQLLVNEYVDTPAGFATLRTLFTANSPLLDDYYRGYYLLQAKDNVKAIEALNRFLGRPDDKVPQPPLPANLPKEGQDRLARGWFFLANAYEAKGDLPRAKDEYRELLNRLPQAAIAPEALNRLARLAERQNQPDEAMGLYAQLAERYPADELADDAAYSRIRLSIAKGPEATQPLVDALAQKFPASSRLPQAYYELGKAFQVKNNASAARGAFQKAASTPRFDFWAVRAAERLTDAYDPNKPPRSNPVTHPAVYSPQNFAADLERDRKAFETWLGQGGWTASSNGGTPQLETVRSRLKDDPGLKRLVELKALGRNTQASREAREATERYTDNPLELAALALFLSEQGEHYYSVTAAKRLQELHQQKFPEQGLRNAPLLLQKLIYPLPFQPMILEQSRRHDFDPLLLISLVKQESAFLPEATSSVGARGLAQVMPETGKGIAGGLSKPSFKVDDLYLPYTAIEFGSYYLANRLKDFEGNPYQALAAYNGGAGNVYRWNKIVDSDANFDGWVQGIDFAETRGYVQIVYANYWMYRQLYAAS